jgi:hypothetical protein
MSTLPTTSPKSLAMRKPITGNYLKAGAVFER